MSIVVDTHTHTHACIQYINMALDFSSLFLTEWGRVIQRIQVLYYFREVLFVEAEILVVSVL